MPLSPARHAATVRRLLLALAAALVLLVAVAPAPGMAQSGAKLTILYTTENHGAWEPWEVAPGVKVGGIARRATLIKQLKAQGGPVLTVDSGDIGQRALLFAQYKGREVRDLYNAVGYDAVAVGNHELDFGPTALLDNMVTGANFAVLSANADLSVEPRLKDQVKPYVVKDIGGQKIGLIGVMHDYLRTAVNPKWGVFSTDPVAATRAAVKELQGQGVNKIVVLSHIGTQGRQVGQRYDDIGLAEAVDGVDIIVGGHDETLLADPGKLPAWASRPAGPSPTVVKSPSGAPVLVVNGWKWGALLGKLDVTFDDQGVAQSWAGELLPVDDKLAEDAQVAGVYKTLAAAAEEVKKQIVGKATADFPGDRGDVRAKEAALGNLVADAMLEVTQQDNTQIAMMNGGGIRVTLKAGDISYGDVLTVLPFGNAIISMDLKGADVLAALENGVSAVTPDSPGGSGGRFAQVSGVRFNADLSKSVGQRVSNVEVGNAKTGYKPLDPNATYRVATNDFMAAGGDGYTAFAKGTAINPAQILLADALADTIRSRGTVSPVVEGRVNLTGRPAPVPAGQTTAVAAPAATPAATTAPAATPAATRAAATAAAPAPATTRAPALAATLAPTAAPPLPATGGETSLAWLVVLGALLALAGSVAFLAARRGPARR